MLNRLLMNSKNRFFYRWFKFFDYVRIDCLNLENLEMILLFSYRVHFLIKIVLLTVSFQLSLTVQKFKKNDMRDICYK